MVGPFVGLLVCQFAHLFPATQPIKPFLSREARESSSLPTAQEATTGRPGLDAQAGIPLDSGLV